MPQAAGSCVWPRGSMPSPTTPLASMVRCCSCRNTSLACTLAARARWPCRAYGTTGVAETHWNCGAMLPVWFTDRFPARYVHARLFDWPDTTLADKTLLIPPGLPDGLRAAAPERVVLELLYEAGVRQSIEEVRNIFDSLRSPRKELMSCCTSVQTVLLFVSWARETGVVNADDLLARHPLRTGTNKRWMSRLADCPLLSLNPHG